MIEYFYLAIDSILTGTATPDKSGPKSNGNERTCTLYSPTFNTEASSSSDAV